MLSDAVSELQMLQRRRLETKCNGGDLPLEVRWKSEIKINAMYPC